MTTTLALAPARQAAVVAGASGLVVDAAAITAILALVSVSPGTALAFAVNVLVSGIVSRALSRRSLRRGLRASDVRIPVGRLPAPC